jgi:lipopolysaccharide transport system ATP-binding protein
MLEFADIGEFIDRPIKVYSSGMHARVAFAMYAFLEPEVLVVDEVLSVGDAAFQRKCYRRMEQMIQTQQRAVVLVTHDLSAVTKFCARAIWLDGGEVQMVGPSTEVVEAYLKRTLGAVVHDELEMAEADQPPGTNVEEGLGQPVTGQQTLTAAIPATGLLPKSEAAVLYPDHGAELLGMWIENDRGQIASNVRLGDRFTICYAVRFHREQANPVFGIRIATIRGDLLVATNTEMCHAGTGKYAAGDVEIVRWAIGPGLNVGTYFISCGVSEPGEVRRFLLREVDSYQLDVTGDSQSGGMIDLNVRPTLVSATAGSPGTGRSMSMTPIESADS